MIFYASGLCSLSLRERAFKGEVFYKHLIIIYFSCLPQPRSLVSHAAIGMTLSGAGTSSSNGGTTGQGSGTKRPCGKGS